MTRRQLAVEVEDALRRTEPFREWAVASESVPEFLYHYTSAGALRKIASSQAVWATNLRHMNDAAELRHGADHVKRRVADLASRQTDEAAKSYVRKLIQAVNPFFSTYDVYAFCTSAAEDDLPQWRAYGAGGRGYSLGFRDLGSLVMEGRPRSPTLGKVIYEEKKQAEIVDALLVEGLSWAHANPGEDGAIAAKAALRQVVGEVIPFLKNPAFSTENEWRLISIRVRPLVNAAEGIAEDDGDMEGVRFFERNGRLFPYVVYEAGRPREGNAGDGRAPTLPIHALWKGPQVPAAEDNAIALLKAAHGHSWKVKPSRIPLVE